MKKYGFTVTELLVVISILSIIMIIAIPVTTSVKSTLEKKIAQENLNALEEAAKLLAIDLDDPSSDIYNCTDISWLTCSNTAGKWSSVTISVSNLKNKGYFEDNTNNCKVDGTITIQKEATGYAYTFSEGICS